MQNEAMTSYQRKYKQSKEQTLNTVNGSSEAHSSWNSAFRGFKGLQRGRI